MADNLPVDSIVKRIYLIRGHKVMLSSDLAELYEVESRVLIQAVKRNIRRFPEDFMFQLSVDEYKNLKSQNVTSSWGGVRRAMPYAFTEQGVAMLSSVLKSDRAIDVNIVIIRTFVKLRQMLVAHKELGRKMAEMERKYDYQFKIVFEVLNELMAPEKPKRKIGFATDK